MKCESIKDRRMWNNDAHVEVHWSHLVALTQNIFMESEERNIGRSKNISNN